MNKNKDDRNKFKRDWRVVSKSRFDLDINYWEKFRGFKI